MLGAVLVLVPAILAQSTNPSAAGKPARAVSGQDFSGVWVAKSGQSSSFLSDGKQEPPLTAWGRAQFKFAKSAGKTKQSGIADTNDPHHYCDPIGVPRADLSKRPIEIVQTEDEIYIFYEEDHIWRQIYMDGRAIPEAPDPSYLGYSVGRWEGDTLVVETAGFNDQTWLDDAGHPHSDALHVVERFRRAGSDALQVSVTIEDPKAYSKIWTSAPRNFQPKRGYEFVEDYCVPADSLGARKAGSPPEPPEK